MPSCKRWYQDKRLHNSEEDLFNDMKAGALPQVTFIISAAFYSEHPPLNIVLGEKKMASVNNHFNTSTPAFNNDLAQGNAGPPAPPRDGLAQIGDFYEAFDFTQNPDYYPKLST